MSNITQTEFVQQPLDVGIYEIDFSAKYLAGTGDTAGALLRPRSAADATGTAAAARIRTASGGDDIITGLTVGLSAADVILDSVSITAGQTVTINSAVFTHA